MALCPLQGASRGLQRSGSTRLLDLSIELVGALHQLGELPRADHAVEVAWPNGLWQMARLATSTTHKQGWFGQLACQWCQSFDVVSMPNFWSSKLQKLQNLKADKTHRKAPIRYLAAQLTLQDPAAQWRLASKPCRSRSLPPGATGVASFFSVPSIW